MTWAWDLVVHSARAFLQKFIDRFLYAFVYFGLLCFLKEDEMGKSRLSAVCH